MFEEDDWYFREAQQLSGLIPAVTGSDLLVLVDQDRRSEAKCFYAPGNGLNLPARVFAGIVRIRCERIRRKKREAANVRAITYAGQKFLRVFRRLASACGSHLRQPSC